MKKRHFAILGDSVEAYVCVNILARAFSRDDLDLSLIEPSNPSRFPPVMGSLPSILELHKLIGLDVVRFESQTRTAHCLGQGYEGFGLKGGCFNVPWSDYGFSVDNIDFLQSWLFARKGGMPASLEDFSLSLSAAKAGRFSKESFLLAGNKEEVVFSYNLEPIHYRSILRDVARSRGVKIFTSDEVKFDRTDTHITSVSLTDGKVIPADFYISDKTWGARHLHEKIELSWQNWLPSYDLGDVSVIKRPPSSLAPLLNVTKKNESGISCHYGLKDVDLIRHYHLSDDKNAAHIPKRLENLWAGNVLSIGAEAVSFDPKEPFDLHGVHQATVFLISLFPKDQNYHTLALEYNRICGDFYDRIRDFQILSYALSPPAARWQKWSAHAPWADLPLELAGKLNLFSALGRLVLYDEETLEKAPWQHLLIGLGLMPHSYERVVDELDEQKLIKLFQTYLKDIGSHIAKMPPYRF